MEWIFVPDGSVIDNNEWYTDYDDEYYDDHRATASSDSGDFLRDWDICYGDGEYTYKNCPESPLCGEISEEPDRGRAKLCINRAP